MFFTLQGAKAIVFSEEIAGKYPDVAIFDHTLHASLAPTCVTTAEARSRVQETVGLADGGGHQFKADFSGLTFPVPRTPTSKGGMLELMEDNLQRLLSSKGNVSRQWNQDNYEVLYTLIMETPGGPLESPMSLLRNLSPPEREAARGELMNVQLSDACRQSTLEACRRCYGLPTEGKFLNSQDFSGKVAHVRLSQRQVQDREFCLYNYQDYALLLEDFGVLGVIFSTGDDSYNLMAEHEGPPFARPNVPSFGMKDISSLLLDDIGKQTEKTLKKRFKLKLTSKFIGLPAYGPGKKAARVLYRKPVTVGRSDPAGIFTYYTDEDWDFGAPEADVDGMETEVCFQNMCSWRSRDGLMRMIHRDDIKFTVWEVLQRPQPNGVHPGGMEEDVRFHRAFGFLDEFYSPANMTLHEKSADKALFHLEYPSVSNGTWKGARLVQQKPSEQCSLQTRLKELDHPLSLQQYIDATRSVRYNPEEISSLFEWCLQSCSAAHPYESLESYVSPGEDIVVYFDALEFACAPSLLSMIDAFWKQGKHLYKGTGNVKAILIATDTRKISLFMKSLQGKFPYPVFMIHPDTFRRHKVGPYSDLNSKEIYISLDTVVETRYRRPNGIKSMLERFVYQDLEDEIERQNGKSGLEVPPQQTSIYSTAARNWGTRGGALDLPPTWPPEWDGGQEEAKLRAKSDLVLEAVCGDSPGMLTARIINVARAGFGQVAHPRMNSTVHNLQPIEGNQGQGMCGEVVLVRADPACSTVGCIACNEDFSNLNLKGKIAFFPLMAVSENGTRLSNMGAFDEATKLWDEEIDMVDKGSSASIRAPTHISDIMINIVDQLEASGHIHGSCLLPMHYLVSLLERRGAQAVIIGNTLNITYGIEYKGMPQEPGIPVFNVMSKVTNWYYEWLTEKENGPLVVEIAECREMYSEKMATYFLAEVENPAGVMDRPDWMRDTMARDSWLLNSTVDDTAPLDVGELAEIETEEQRAERWAYEVALWGGVALVCAAAGVVALMIRRYRGRLGAGGSPGVRTIGLYLSSDQGSGRQERNPNAIYEQGTYGWGPFRDSRSFPR